MESPKPHPHAELIKAWAVGAEIQYWDPFGLPSHSPIGNRSRRQERRKHETRTCKI